ncbi:MAG: SUMF1/EgtB/PvdO family nonheme iron enzyme [Pirellulales bacterium]
MAKRRFAAGRRDDDRPTASPVDARRFAAGRRASFGSLRGGSWNNNSYNLQSSNRNNNNPTNENNNIGFRVASP